MIKVNASKKKKFKAKKKKSKSSMWQIPIGKFDIHCVIAKG